jgi:DNA-binding MarR family transcriptional regulator
VDIVRKDPPSGKVAGPSTSLDQLICGYLALIGAGDARPMTIADHLGRTTQDVHARLKVLTKRGVIEKHKRPDAPANGPGSAFYAITEAGRAALAPKDS